MLYATPYIEDDGTLSMCIMNHHMQVDIVTVQTAIRYQDEHSIPMRVLNSAFDEVFEEGHRYRKIREWNYPFFGDQIGCSVELME